MLSHGSKGGNFVADHKTSIMQDTIHPSLIELIHNVESHPDRAGVPDRPSVPQ